MNACINKKSYEFQSLKERTGLSTLFLESEIIDYQDRHNGRWPTPAEIAGSDTTAYAKQDLNISNKNAVETQKLLDKFEANDTMEITKLLNTQDTYNDLEFDILPLNTTSLVNIKHRPSKYFGDFDKRFMPDEVVNSKLVFDNAFQKLASLYGVQFNQIRRGDLHSDPKFRDIISTDPNPKAFILDGQVYINMDNYSVDSPIHELSHMLIGHLRFIKPDMYMQLISLSEQLPGYQEYLDIFPNRTRNDVNEEIFVTEYSKFITGQQSLFDQLDSDVRYQIQFQVQRIIDSVLEGSLSVSDLKLKDMGNYSLKDIANLVNSSKMTSIDSFPLEDSSAHRRMNNLKSDLMKSGELKEVCE